MVDLNRVLSAVGEEQAFRFSDGSIIRSLGELADKIRSLDEASFSNHVNTQRNDFANWINNVFKDEILGQRISKVLRKDDLITEIKTRLEQAKQTIQIQQSPTIPKTQEKPLPPPTQVPATRIKTQEAPRGLDDDLDLDTDLTQEPSPKPIRSQAKPPATPTPKEEVSKVEEPIKPPTPTPIPPPKKSSGELDDDLDAGLNLEDGLDTSLEAKDSAKKVGLSSVPTQPSIIKEEKPTPPPTPAPIPKPAVDAHKELVDKLKPIEKPIVQSTPTKPKPSSTPAVSMDSLTPEEKKLLEKDNKALKPKELFAKFKLQKRLKGGVATPSTAKPSVLSAPKKVEEGKIVSESLEGLSAEEKRLLDTDNKQLNPKELFNKFKLQKRLELEKTKKTEEEEKAAAIPTVQTISTDDKAVGDLEKPVDLLNISDEKFYELIGVSTDEEEFNAIVSTEEIVERRVRKHLKTGVPGFDDLIDEGILEGSSVLVSGGPGSGKTTFSIQQLGWAAEKGEKCLFISLEEKEERLIEHMETYGLNPKKLIDNGTLKIKKLDSFKLSRSVEALLAQARGELMIDIDPVMDIIPSDFKPDRIVLDSLSSIAAAFAGQPEVYRIYVEQLFIIFERLGVTSFIITEIQGSETVGHGGVEDFLADGVINFYNIKQGAIRQPALEILKMRGVKHKKKIVPFGFIGGKGIEVYPLEEVFYGDEE
ncbi:hypothetical protein GOV05_01130 [Candidatus Woesearchaeota archaeon]|nr:hypothetical protein [Candidatus Woesearchaeota archaeon]